MRSFVLPKRVLDSVISHCLEEYPVEACGIISGKGSKATRAFRLPNAENSPVRYLAEPGEQFRVMKRIEDEGEEMIAIYHSHPGSPPYPSQRDVELAFFPDCFYLIVSLSAGHDVPEARAFLIAGGAVQEVELSAL